MQRVSSIVKERENQENSENKTINTIETTNNLIEISPEILFLLSRYTNGLINNRLYAGKNSNAKNPKNIRFCIPNRFSHDFGITKNIESLIIKSSCLVNLSYLEGLNIKKLEFEKIIAFEITNLQHINVLGLTLKNINITLDTLGKLISTLMPFSLELINIQLTDQTHSHQQIEFYKMILKSNIHDFHVENSFIPVDRFFEIINKKQINKFKYESNASIIKYRNMGCSFSYLMVRNLDLSKFYNPSWISVEILSNH